MQQALKQLHDFWFATGTDWPNETSNKRWFMGGAAFDTELQARFSELIVCALAGKLDAVATSNAQAIVALILAYDQLPRNIFRGTARAFAGDSRAQALTKGLRSDGRFARLAPAERMFVLMPLMHAEDLVLQDECVHGFEEYAVSAPPLVAKMAQGSLKFARAHRDIIAQFGRFPYRNVVLRRAATHDEQQWLATNDINYGQKPAS